MIVDEEVYLEHFGVLGMRWGVRNDKRKKAQQQAFDKLSPREQKKSRIRKKVFRAGVKGGLAGLAIGTVAAGAIFLKSKQGGQILHQSVKLLHNDSISRGKDTVRALENSGEMTKLAALYLDKDIKDHGLEGSLEMIKLHNRLFKP